MNKARYFFSLFGLIGCLHAIGQDTVRATGGKAVFGIALGPNLTRASLASYIPTSPAWGNYTSSTLAVGFDASVFVLLPMGQTVYFRPELGFSLLNQKQLYSDSKFLNSELSTNNRDRLTESQLLYEHGDRFRERQDGEHRGIFYACRAEQNGYLQKFRGRHLLQSGAFQLYPIRSAVADRQGERLSAEADGTTLTSILAFNSLGLL
jgi:hypothetical protein